MVRLVSPRFARRVSPDSIRRRFAPLFYIVCACVCVSVDSGSQQSVSLSACRTAQQQQQSRHKVFVPPPCQQKYYKRNDRGGRTAHCERPRKFCYLVARAQFLHVCGTHTHTHTARSSTYTNTSSTHTLCVLLIL